jgi:hypothetical protein
MDANTFVILYGSAATGQAGPPPPVFDPTYQLILDAMTANGIPQPTEPQKQKQNTLVVDLKAALGDWDRIKSLRVYAGTNQQAALLDWKRYFVMNAVNGPVHSEALGFKGDGMASHINTGFNTFTDPYYSLTAGQDSSSIVGAITADGTNANFKGWTGQANFRLIQDNNNTLRRGFAFAATGTVVSAYELPDIVGASRPNGTEQAAYRNGGTPALGAFGRANSTNHVSIDCGSGGSSRQFSDNAVGLVMYANALTPAEFQAVRAAIQTYLTP